MTGSSLKKRVAVMFGGRSVEHAISILTALDAAEALDPVRFEAFLVYVDLRGRWWTGTALTKLKKQKFCRLFNEAASPETFEGVDELVFLAVPGKGLHRMVKPTRARRLLSFGRSGSTILEPLGIDVYLPLFHGTKGEDGCVQGLLEFAEVPFTGCEVRAAALGMNKALCKDLVRAAGVPVLPHRLVEKSLWRPSLSEVSALTSVAQAQGFGDYPYFVKPVNLGSSVGIGKASSPETLLSAIMDAFKFDVQVMVEPAVEKLYELNVGVRLEEGRPVASVVEQPRAHDGVLDYDTKYLADSGKSKLAASSGMASMSRLIDPETVCPRIKEAAREYACRVYGVLGCRGVARIDFLVRGTDHALFFNEINTLPGSLAYYLFSESRPPIPYTDLLSSMIEDAVHQHTIKQELQRDFGFKALHGSAATSAS